MLPTPHESPCYPDPLTNLPSLPSPSPFLSSSSTVTVSTGSPLPSHCYQTMSAFMSPIHTTTNLETCSHPHKHFLRASPEWSVEAYHPYAPPPTNKKDNMSPRVSQPACLLASQSPTMHAFRYIRCSSRMPYSSASRSAGCCVDLKLSLSSRWQVGWWVETDEGAQLSHDETKDFA